MFPYFLGCSTYRTRVKYHLYCSSQRSTQFGQAFLLCRTSLFACMTNIARPHFEFAEIHSWSPQAPYTIRIHLSLNSAVLPSFSYPRIFIQLAMKSCPAKINPAVAPIHPATSTLHSSSNALPFFHPGGHRPSRLPLTRWLGVVDAHKGRILE